MERYFCKTPTLMHYFRAEPFIAIELLIYILWAGFFSSVVELPCALRIGVCVCIRSILLHEYQQEETTKWPLVCRVWAGY